MDLRNFPGRNILSRTFDSAGATANNQIDANPPTAGLPRPANNGDLRLTVESQFMRMNEAHDRHRAKVLGSYSPGMKFKI